MAAPLASSFVIWVTGILGSVVAFHKAKSLLHRSRYAVAVAAIMAGCFSLYLATSNTSSTRLGRTPMKIAMRSNP